LYFCFVFAQIFYPLFLSDVSGTEILVIFLVILIFFGSKSIPTMARTLGRTMKEIRNASADLQQEIKKSGLDVKKDLNLNAFIQQTEEQIKQPLDQVLVDINETVHYGSANLNEAAQNMNQVIEQNPITETADTNLDTLNPQELIETKIDTQITKTELDGESRNNNG
jgi:sec-independent protein translocase protein TatA